MTPGTPAAARRVVVTGAGAGIGRAIALRFIAEGAWVHGLDRDPDALRRVGEAAAAGEPAPGTPAAVTPVGRFIPYLVDLADRDAADRTADVLLTALDGRCDTLVNNAGISRLRSFEHCDDPTLDALFAVNFVAAFRLTRRLAPALRASGRGCVINVASELALVGQAGYCAYSATKGAILAWSRGLAVEWAPAVRVNAVCPGPVDTSLLDADFAATGEPGAARLAEEDAVPLGRIGVPGDIAGVVAFLASDAAGFVTGAAWTVDGGKTAA